MGLHEAWGGARAVPTPPAAQDGQAVCVCKRGVPAAAVRLQSGEAYLLRKGQKAVLRHELQSPGGLAWSGDGEITRVDVSRDGGITWETARLGRQGDSKALTRFYLDVNWDGSEMLLQSRAIDETGYVQPTKAQLRAVRGENSVYHNNCIQTWYVNAEGIAENVEVS